MEDWWYKNIGDEIVTSRRGGEEDHWYYKEDEESKCSNDKDEQVPTKQPNIIFVLADDWGE